MCLDRIRDYCEVDNLSVFKIFQNRGDGLYLPFRGDRDQKLPMKKWLHEIDFRGSKTYCMLQANIGTSYRTGFHTYDDLEELSNTISGNYVLNKCKWERFSIHKCFIHGDVIVGTEDEAKVYVSNMLYITDEEADYVRRP